jgi:tetratricopeptide (TPR) repeat protein
VAERLARQDPANADWQRDLSISHERIGAIRQAQGDMAGARESYEAYQAMAERLARQDPTNADWQRNLSISHEKIGDIRQAQGDLAGALESYEADMAIAERLARQDPANAEWQRDLAVSHNKIGTIRQAQNDLAGARESFEQVLAITVPLFERTQAAEAPRFLGFVYKRLVDLCAAQGDLTAALRYQQDLVAQVRETDNPPGLIHGLQVLFGFESLTGNDRAALAAIAEAIRIARGLHQAHPDEASRSWLALTLGHQSSALLLARQYQEAIAAAEEALGLDPSQTAIYTKQAHGYLLTGQFDKALAIYRAHAKDQANDDQTSAEVVLDDFAALRQRGIDHPDMKRIEALLKTGGKPAAPAAKTGRRMR